MRIHLTTITRIYLLKINIWKIFITVHLFQRYKCGLLFPQRYQSLRVAMLKEKEEEKLTFHFTSGQDLFKAAIIPELFHLLKDTKAD